MENKRWFEEKMDEQEELENYIANIFYEYIEEMGKGPRDNWTFWSWENINEDYLHITATYKNDYEDDTFRISREYFWEPDSEKRRNMMAREYAQEQKKKREEEERKEQERLERKKAQLKKLKEELGEE